MYKRPNRTLDVVSFARTYFFFSVPFVILFHERYFNIFIRDKKSLNTGRKCCVMSNNEFNLLAEKNSGKRIYVGTSRLPIYNIIMLHARHFNIFIIWVYDCENITMHILLNANSSDRISSEQSKLIFFIRKRHQKFKKHKNIHHDIKTVHLFCWKSTMIIVSTLKNVRAYKWSHNNYYSKRISDYNIFVW